MPKPEVTYNRKRMLLEYDSRIGKVLAALREERDLSQAEVARSIGSTQPQISKVEQGQRSLRLSEIKLVAKAFDLTPEELFEILLPALQDEQ